MLIVTWSPAMRTSSLNFDPHRPDQREDRLVKFVGVRALVLVLLGPPRLRRRLRRPVAIGAIRRERLLDDSALGPRKMLETRDAVRRPGRFQGPTPWATLAQLALRGKMDAMGFAEEIRALPPLELDAAGRPAMRQAKTWLDFDAVKSVETMAHAERRIQNLPANLTLLESTHAPSGSSSTSSRRIPR